MILDTHVFIWLDNAPERVSGRARQVFADPENEVLLSVISIWEMQIKLSLGKLKLRQSLASMIQEQLGGNSIQLLPLKIDHILQLEQLPPHHHDPFDRVLITQAQIEEAVLLTDDRVIQRYPVNTHW